jgi:hypothetical protein
MHPRLDTDLGSAMMPRAAERAPLFWVLKTKFFFEGKTMSKLLSVLIAAAVMAGSAVAADKPVGMAGMEAKKEAAAPAAKKEAAPAGMAGMAGMEAKKDDKKVVAKKEAKPAAKKVADKKEAAPAAAAAAPAAPAAAAAPAAEAKKEAAKK